MAYHVHRTARLGAWVLISDGWYKPPWQVGFCVHKRRWVVERCFAWLGRNRRLAKEFEATIASATAFLYAASVMLLVRRLARCG